MTSFFKSISRALRDSVLAQLGLAMGTLALLSFISIVMSTVVADNISGKASAINLSGSLRMLSFRTLSEVQQPEKRRQAFDTIEQFERRLNSLDRFIKAKSAGNVALDEASRIIVDHWQSDIRPLARASAEGNVDALNEMAKEIPVFVGQIDQVVQLIEEDLERKVKFLRATQFVLLAIVVLLSLVTTWMLRRQLMQPLAELLKAAKTVSQGSFTARVQHVTNDELGRMGLAFNTMIGEIANMYAHLEDKVEEKTRELTRTNQSLELLYRTSQQLSASDLKLDMIQAILKDVEEALELGHSMVCISENGHLPAHSVIGDLLPEELQALCGEHDCEHCFERSRVPLAEQAAAADSSVAQVLFLPIGDSEKLRGTMPLFINAGDSLPREKARIIETVGHHVSNALSNMRRAEEKHRLAVLEERSAIARELHDSIAQSLSYLKIQVTRLEKNLSPETDAYAIAQELKNGLSSAYRELRELITTFRLRIDERGFNAALEETIAEFSEKLGFQVRLANALAGITLSGNEEMHVIRVIREALSNIERHAGASSAGVDIELSAEHDVSVRIADNGHGFDPGSTPANHYGTSIMHDRSAILGGTLRIDSQPGVGSTVTLVFRPQQYCLPTA